MDKTQLAIEVFNKCAVEYQEKFMDVGLYEDTLKLFCGHLTQHAHVLELACGPGNITKYLLTQRPDLKILGTDLAPNMVALAQKNNPQATFKIMDCRDICKIGDKYDGIMCGFCLPYLSKEEAIKLLQGVAQALKPNGMLYISTMEDDYNKSSLQTSSSGNQLYIHYHQADYLTAALVENNFTISHIRHQGYPTDGGDTTDLIIIAQKQ
jgi:2-polyprenyl-3-methyl-5-hydroxy-6-metoxy-1,4-benzoquinol methylase